MRTTTPHVTNENRGQVVYHVAGQTFRPTRKDPTLELTVSALGCLAAAKALRMRRASWIEEAIKAYAWIGTLTSGCEQTHWPDEVKDRLRTNARAIGQAVEDAYTCWRKAGRQLSTLRPIAATYRTEGSRY